MIRKVFLRGFGALGLAGLVATGTAAELRAIALNATADFAQVTLDLTEAPPQRLFTLDHPDRVVIDLPHTRLADGVHVPAASGVVTAVRLGSQPYGTLRVVVQLRSALPAHDTWGTGAEGRRLVLTFGEPVVAAAPETGPKIVRALHAPGDGSRDVIVAVDAGHGGVDPGAIGRGGTREKDVTLAIARALAVRIDAEPGMHAVLTRNRDEFLELRERIARARALRADMFVSVHADSIVDRSVAGASVYVLSVHGASSEAARWLAERENAADLLGGPRRDGDDALRPVLIDETQSQIIGLSATAAEQVVSALQGVGDVRKAEVQHAGFVVLKSREIPSMLVETAYISNPSEERRLRSTEQQTRLAEAIAAGLRSYFLQNPPDGTRFKQERRSTLASAADATGTTTP
ncbi:MAG TPA: N-acetylmuramoyl-L-alanine amidase [Steroidobacteraceae bacterium]|jgi:N-acetylmuramoyl-L-alanine amidase|nr:N-acetylmuramoyl-L-alanine amidase [Steroidobacteraceae bacterium]